MFASCQKVSSASSFASFSPMVLCMKKAQFKEKITKSIFNKRDSKMAARGRKQKACLL
jgi:hypothetical protein